jgi:RNA polymerase sigma-70 factor (ECF subfamily)
MKLGSNEVEPPQDELFQQLMAQNQRALFYYILSMVPRTTDAEEILQETNVTLLRNSQDFERGTNFKAWAFRVAYFVSMQHRQRKHREALTFDSDLVDTLAEEASDGLELAETRWSAFKYCLQKLRPADSGLLMDYYKAGTDRASLANTAKRPLGSIYKSISRIRKTLLQCVTRRISLEDFA